MYQHWIWLSTRRGIGTKGRADLLRLFGSAERIYAMTEAQYKGTEGFEERWLEPLLDKSLEEAEEILAQCDEKEIDLLTYCDDSYPELLKNISDPPVLLYYKGRLPDLNEEVTITVVGSRKCTAYGLLHAKQFSKLIANSGAVVISGGARGIDSMALRGALDSNMPVICVLGCGVDVTYPKENYFLFRDVAHHGCLISEYPPGTPPEGRNFPVRNRIMSGMSLGVLVVEAPEKSGALITAQAALDQGRDVYAIPGNLGVKSCQGSNQLLREGAMMVDNGWDVVKDYAYRYPDKIQDGRVRDTAERIFRIRYGMKLPVYSPLAYQEGNDKKPVDNPPAKAYSEKKELPAGLSADEGTVFQTLGPEPVQADEIVAKTGLTAQRVTVALTMLQIKGKVQQLPGAYYRQKI